MIVLASASPRRLALLQQIGVTCQVTPADIDETASADEKAGQFVLRLAEEKSAATYHAHNRLPVLAADTSISFNGKILGKPRNESDALSMLLMLSGQQHQVMTGVSVRSALGAFSLLCSTEVRFRELSHAQIHAYCATGEPLGKAGSYAIQGLGAVLVESIKGSYSNVVGLPLYETSLLLEKSGVPVL